MHLVGITTIHNSAYQRGKVVAYFPNPTVSYANQPTGAHIGVFLKYEKIGNGWGFWIADQGWYYDGKIRKHYVSSDSPIAAYNANNYRFVDYNTVCN